MFIIPHLSQQESSGQHAKATTMQSQPLTPSHSNSHLSPPRALISPAGPDQLHLGPLPTHWPRSSI